MNRSPCSLLLLAGLALAAGSTGTAAATKAGVTMPDSMQLDGRTMVLNGMGLRAFTLLQIRGYVGGLYLTRKTSDAETALDEPNPKALVIHYVRGATFNQVHDLYMDSSKKYCAHHSCTEAAKTSFEALLGTVRAVKPGDETSFLMTDKGVQVIFDGQTIVQLTDPGFGRIILESDLGSAPPSEQLKNGMLGSPD